MDVLTNDGYPLELESLTAHNWVYEDRGAFRKFEDNKSQRALARETRLCVTNIADSSTRRMRCRSNATVKKFSSRAPPMWQRLNQSGLNSGFFDARGLDALASIVAMRARVNDVAPLDQRPLLLLLQAL